MSARIAIMLTFTVAIAATAQSLIPDDVPVDPLWMNSGESACVFPYTHTAEDSIWVSPGSVYRNASQSCIFKIKKIGPGVWRINLGGVPLRRTNIHDSELVPLKYLRLGSVSEVIVRN